VTKIFVEHGLKKKRKLNLLPWNLNAMEWSGPWPLMLGTSSQGTHFVPLQYPKWLLPQVNPKKKEKEMTNN
jgi:hypothetical protein